MDCPPDSALLALRRPGQDPGASAEVTVPGIHFIQEDSGAEIGRAIAAWLRQFPG